MPYVRFRVPTVQEVSTVLAAAVAIGVPVGYFLLVFNLHRIFGG